jgi:hypothetical protein
MRSSAGPERRRASCEQPELIEYDSGSPPATSLKGAPRLRDDYGSDAMAARTVAKTTTAMVEAISTTAFPSPATISNATVFHSVPIGRLKRSDIDFFLWSVDASILQVHPVD